MGNELTWSPNSDDPQTKIHKDFIIILSPYVEMVKHYLSIVQADLDKSHKPASPVDNWWL